MVESDRRYYAINTALVVALIVAAALYIAIMSWLWQRSPGVVIGSAGYFVVAEVIRNIRRRRNQTTHKQASVS